MIFLHFNFSIAARLDFLWMCKINRVINNPRLLTVFSEDEREIRLVPHVQTGVLAVFSTVSFPIIYFRFWKTLIFGTFLLVIRPEEAFKLLQTERTFALSIAMINAHILLHEDSAIDLWKNYYGRLKIQTSPLRTPISRRILNISTCFYYAFPLQNHAESENHTL